MTREEAIKVIKNNWPDGRCMLQEALTIAIDALKNPWHKVSEELPKVDKYRKCIKENRDRCVDYENAVELLKKKDQQFKAFLNKIGRGEKWAAFERFVEESK